MLKEAQKLDAIAWKAGQEKISYGKFIISLSEDEKKQIYEEYELQYNEKQEEENKRILRMKLNAGAQKDKGKQRKNRPIW
ncbi:MAG: hypothetical protein LIP11_13485 [Clostridiales bacterium]|nr:hypothetical protein [Clostridiales bacterium]